MRGFTKSGVAALGGLGALSGIVTALLGKSGSTPARGQATSPTGKIANIALAIAGPAFAAILLIFLSAWLDLWVLGGPLETSAILLWPNTGAPHESQWWSIGIAVLALFLIMLTADFFVNVNRFSLHATYRNRLIRAFLGGLIRRTEADGFTGFDPDDNLRMRDLWDEHARERGDLAPVSRHQHDTELGGVEKARMAAAQSRSFTVTPQFCGCANLGYRKTEEYGDPGGGISVGTAMAISGAADSPNIGYHSSPSIAFLLTLLNVRLGWWLGEPGSRRQQGRLVLQTRESVQPQRVGDRSLPSGRALALLAPVAVELFGLTDDNSPYVYLSDGGHFEDLAIYEMVRRRCRWIVVSDADADPGRGFEDLAMPCGRSGSTSACGSPSRNPPAHGERRHETDRHALLRLGQDRIPERRRPGADRSYPLHSALSCAATNPWRTSSPISARTRIFRTSRPPTNGSTSRELESYRVLGYWMTRRIVDGARRVGSVHTLEKFFRSLEKLDFSTLERIGAAFDT